VAITGDYEAGGAIATHAGDASAHHAPVTIAAGRDYVTLAGQELSLGLIDLATDVSGVLPDAAVASTLARDSEVTSAVSAHAGDAAAHQALVTLAGTPDYLTLSGQELIRGLIDLETDVTGVLTARNAGTGTGESDPVRLQIAHDFSPGVPANVDLQAYIADVGDPVRIYITTDGEFGTGNERLLTTEDEGSGVGLDADTVDLVHAAALGQLGATQTWTGVHTFQPGAAILKKRTYSHTVDYAIPAGECYWTSHYVMDAGVDFGLPALAEGMSTSIIVAEATASEITPNSADAIVLDGTLLATGNRIVAPGAGGDVLVLEYLAPNTWAASSTGFTDGGAP
jgi:hypothetical protein